MIVSPLGEVLAGPLFDKEGILYADLNMDEITDHSTLFTKGTHSCDLSQFSQS